MKNVTSGMNRYLQGTGNNYASKRLGIKEGTQLKKDLIASLKKDMPTIILVNPNKLEKYGDARAIADFQAAVNQLWPWQEGEPATPVRPPHIISLCFALPARKHKTRDSPQ